MATTPKGFTLLELILSMAIVSMLAVIAIPFYLSFQARSDYALSIKTTVQSLRRAQTLARAGEYDASWGVHVAPSVITLFQGANYASRNAEFDELFSAPANMVISGLEEVVFAELTGLPETSGVITFESASHDIVAVSVNEQGMIEY